MPAMSLLALVAVLVLASPAAAQTVTAVCTYAQWTFFQGNSPCQVWGNLQAVCNSSAVVGTLDTSTNSDATYPSPSGSSATPCQCNVVAYNLMAGCSWCQPNVYSFNWVSETQWKAGCSSYDSTGLPSQASSVSNQIPPWAMLTENGQSWEDFEASSIALSGATGFTGTFLPTATGTGPLSSYTYTGPFNGDDGTSGVVFDLARAIAIPVGIVLGSYLIIGGIVLAVFLTRQKNRKAWYGSTAAYYRNGGRYGEPNMVQPLLGPQSPSPFPGSSAAGTPGSTYPTTPYQPTFNSPPSTFNSPPVSQPNANYLQDYQTTPYQTTPSPAGGQHLNTYYDPNAQPTPPVPVGMPQGPSPHLPEL